MTVSYCVRRYKSDFLRHLNAAVDVSDDNEALKANVSQMLADTIMEEAATHKLWYDIRHQTLFDDRFREVVNEIEAQIISAIDRILKQLQPSPAMPASYGYAVLDGVFQHALHGRIKGDLSCSEDITALFRGILDRL